MQEQRCAGAESSGAVFLIRLKKNGTEKKKTEKKKRKKKKNLHLAFL